jgi:hypothetical protein
MAQRITMFTNAKRSPILVLSTILFAISACVNEQDDDDLGDSSLSSGFPSTTSNPEDPGEESSDSGSPPISTSEQMCEKYDYCNALGVGFSVDDCIDAVEDCVTGMPSGAQVDWWADVDSCLEKQDCGNFFECMSDQGACSLLTCNSDCDWCHIGTEYEGACPDDWFGDGECDCGCQWTDIDC